MTDELVKQDEALIKSFILNKALTLQDDKPLSDFYMWQHQVSHHVPVIETPKSGPVAKYISQLVDFHGVPQVKDCYANAVNLCQFSVTSGIRSGITVNYIEGYSLTDGRVLVPHAWNEYDGNYFDITMDQMESMHPDRKKWRTFYLKVIDLDPVEAWCYSPKRFEPLQVLHYLKLNRLPKKTLKRREPIIESHVLGQSEKSSPSP